MKKGRTSNSRHAVVFLSLSHFLPLDYSVLPIFSVRHINAFDSGFNDQVIKDCVYNLFDDLRDKREDAVDTGRTYLFICQSAHLRSCFFREA